MTDTIESLKADVAAARRHAQLAEERYRALDRMNAILLRDVEAMKMERDVALRLNPPLRAGDTR